MFRFAVRGSMIQMNVSCRVDRIVVFVVFRLVCGLEVRSLSYPTWTENEASWLYYNREAPKHPRQ